MQAENRKMKFNFTPFPILKTERLILRQTSIDDCDEVLFLRSNKEVNKYVKRPTPHNLKDAQIFVGKITKGIQNGENIYWCITLKESNKMIGSISLWNFSEDKKTGEVGYDLNPKHQNIGIMSEALNYIVNFGFNTLNLNKIEAFTHHSNESSKKLLTKQNFVHIKHRADEDNADNIIYELKKAST